MSKSSASNRSKKRSANPVMAQPIQAYYARHATPPALDPAKDPASNGLDGEINLFRDMIGRLFAESNLEPDQMEILMKLVNALGQATLRLARLMLANQQLKKETHPQDLLDLAVDELLKVVLPSDRAAGF